MSFDDRLTHSVVDDSFMLLWAGTTDGTFEFAAMSWPKIFEVACKLGLVKHSYRHWKLTAEHCGSRLKNGYLD